MTHGQDAEWIARLLARNRPADAAAMLHRLKGAAGNMALMGVWDQANSLEQALDQQTDAGPRVQDLRQALQAAQVAIAAYAGPSTEIPPTAGTDEASADAAVEALLLALDRDSPDEAENILDRLSDQLPGHRLDAVRERLEAFDFRGAKSLAAHLATQSVPAPEAAHL
jgi:HPt (histidine-containing phosphotransfer) domain-containing protein